VVRLRELFNFWGINHISGISEARGRPILHTDDIGTVGYTIIFMLYGPSCLN